MLGAIGDERTLGQLRLENHPAVESVKPILAPYKLTSTEVKRTRTQVRIGPAQFALGGRRIGVIAGPCAIFFVPAATFLDNSCG